jgi:short-subunit dehydrogenase
MFEYRGRTALVTGASWGIGTAFVRALARRGMDVILVARSTDRLQPLAEEIAREHGARSEVVPADLSAEPSVAALRQEVERRGLHVDLLVNNAGFATHGHFETIPADREHAEIMVNVAAVVGLTHAFVPGMLARGCGAVINVASTAAFQPIPFMTVYAATKAFLVSFSYGLAEEYRGRNLRVVALCPGPTETNFFEVANAQQAAVGRLRTAEQVVATGLLALERGRTFAVDGGMNAVSGYFARMLPASFTARMAGRIVRPRQPEQVKTNSPNA